jgi:hypothetical protein
MPDSTSAPRLSARESARPGASPSPEHDRQHPRRGDGRVADRLVQLAPAQAAHLPNDPDHHVQRMVRLERRPRLVALPRACALRLPARAAPLAATPEQLLLHVPLARSPRLRRHAQSHYHDRSSCQLIEQI